MQLEEVRDSGKAQGFFLDMWHMAGVFEHHPAAIGNIFHVRANNLWGCLVMTPGDQQGRSGDL